MICSWVSGLRQIPGIPERTDTGQPQKSLKALWGTQLWEVKALPFRDTLYITNEKRERVNYFEALEQSMYILSREARLKALKQIARRKRRRLSIQRVVAFLRLY
jgi:hypothetical protein